MKFGTGHIHRAVVANPSISQADLEALAKRHNATFSAATIRVNQALALSILGMVKQAGGQPPATA
jgi:hypothetical protein